MRMHMLSGGRLRMRSGMYFPDVPKDRMQEFPCICVLLRHRGGNVLFDTGCHPSVETGAQARWGNLANIMPPVHRPGDNVLSGLRALGLGPDDIDIVVNSHLHMDHCGCNEFFKRATFFVHARELAAARDPAMEGRGYYRADWDHPMPVEAIQGEKDIFDDNRIVLLPLPGHTPGSIGALIELGNSGRHLLAGDALSVKPTLTSDYMPRNNWDNDEFRKSLDRIRSIESRGAAVVCGHDDAQWSAMRKGAEFYD